jgi:hypothetical protein
MSFSATSRRLGAETVDDLEAGDRHRARSLGDPSRACALMRLKTPARSPLAGGLRFREARLGDVQASEVLACAHEVCQVSSAPGSPEVTRWLNKATLRFGDIIAGQRHGGLLVRQLDLKDRQSAVAEAQFTT